MLNNSREEEHNLCVSKVSWLYQQYIRTCETGISDQSKWFETELLQIYLYVM